MIPSVGGFTAIYNPQMLSLLPAQTGLMMYEGGYMWQAGKRDASRITNDKFNAMTHLDHVTMLQQVREDAMPTVIRGMEATNQLVMPMVEQFGDIAAEAVKAIPDTVKNFFGSIIPQSGNLGYPPPVTNVRYGERTPQFNEPAIEKSKQFLKDTFTKVGGQHLRTTTDDRTKYISYKFPKKQSVHEILLQAGKGTRRVSKQSLQIEKSRLVNEINSLRKKLRTQPHTITETRHVGYTTKSIRGGRWTGGRGARLPKYQKIKKLNPAHQITANKMVAKQRELKALLGRISL